VFVIVCTPSVNEYEIGVMVALLRSSARGTLVVNDPLTLSPPVYRPVTVEKPLPV
jgi:hypothetical protein